MAGWDDLGFNIEDIDTTHSLSANTLNVFTRAIIEKFYFVNGSAENFSDEEWFSGLYGTTGMYDKLKWLTGKYRNLTFNNFVTADEYNNPINIDGNPRQRNPAYFENLFSGLDQTVIDNFMNSRYRCIADFMKPDLFKLMYRLWKDARYVYTKQFDNYRNEPVRSNLWNPEDDLGMMIEFKDDVNIDNWTGTYSAGPDNERLVSLNCNVTGGGCPAGDSGTGRTYQQVMTDFDNGFGAQLPNLQPTRFWLRTEQENFFRGFGGSVNDVYLYDSWARAGYTDSRSGLSSESRSQDNKKGGSGWAYVGYRPSDTNFDNPISFKVNTFGMIDANLRVDYMQAQVAQSNDGIPWPMGNWQSSPTYNDQDDTYQSETWEIRAALPDYPQIDLTGSYVKIKDRPKVPLNNIHGNIAQLNDGKQITFTQSIFAPAEDMTLTEAPTYYAPTSIPFTSNASAMETETNGGYNRNSEELQIYYRQRTNYYLLVPTKAWNGKFNDSSAKYEFTIDLNANGIEFTYD